MNEYMNTVREDLRLRILQILERAPGYETNLHVLSAQLDVIGHRTPMDRVRTEIAWLAEQGLVTTRWVSSIAIPKASERGVEAALGRARVPGVRRPDPE